MTTYFYGIALLQNLKIDDTQPGTLLHDFQIMLDVFHSKEQKLTATQQIPLSVIREINPRLKNPMDVRLKRSQQNSYPRIEGLYLLLRASGLTSLRTKGKTARLIFDEEWLEQWNQFNPTEKYCHLLESWIIRGYEEILGGHANAFGISRTLDKIMTGYRQITAKGMKIKSYKHFRQEFSFYPQTYNLALMELFGMVKIIEGKPVDGDGWQVKKVERTKLGEALLAALFHAIYQPDDEVDDDDMEDFLGNLFNLDDDFDDEDDIEEPVLSEDEPEQPMQFSMLQPLLQEYFPAWQKTIEPPHREIMVGKFTFKVSLANQWSATISLDGEQPMDSLASAILSAVQFDNDHLYEFTYKSRFGKQVSIPHPYSAEIYSTEEIAIGLPGFKPGTQLKFIFDFGDWWEFDVVLEDYNPDKRTKKVEIISTTGEAPEQYPDWDDDDDDGDDDFESFATGFDFD